ncbi:SCO family protein [Rhizosaccharibacter radicis]|uniref:SCO family protein n=1 Tax=Rhizosaccharibacter radicis TaxID=2782605 RepID=A0ABT1W177_9PROT|nr:SCO family protein [Acetobacteraceae bacterium KSS12]
MVTLAAGLLGLLLVAGGIRTLLSSALRDGSPVVGGPFHLRDSEGHALTDRSFRGRFMLVFFGYTDCTDICPQTLTEMTEALDRLDPEARRVQPIFITVDPRHDTPDRLRHYAGSFSPHLLALTGTPDAVQDAERRYHVAVQPVDQSLSGDERSRPAAPSPGSSPAGTAAAAGGPAPAHSAEGTGPAAIAIDHSAVLFLMGPDGNFLAPIPADASRAEMLAALKRYIS